jgi:hypothetical protein
VAESHSTVLRTASSTHWQHSPDGLSARENSMHLHVREVAEIEINLERVPIRNQSVKQQYHPVHAIGILLRPGVAPTAATEDSAERNGTVHLPESRWLGAFD